METPSHCISSPLGPLGPFRADQAPVGGGALWSGLTPSLTCSLLWPRVNTELEALWAPSALIDCTSYPNNVRRKKKDSHVQITVPKLFCALCINPPLSSYTLATIDLFVVSIVLPLQNEEFESFST